MILPADHVLRAVINARLSATLFPPGVIYFYAVPLLEMVESFCNSYYIPDEVHPTAPGRDRTITQFPEGKVGVYTRLFDYCGYRIPLTKFFVAVLKYFRIHISQLSPFGAARVSHFEVLTRVLDLGPSVAVFRAFYTRIYSDGLFSFAKRSLSAPSCLSKPPDSIKNWADHFFWVDSRVFPISVPLYTGGVLEKDPAPHLTARQEQAVQTWVCLTMDYDQLFSTLRNMDYDQLFEEFNVGAARQICLGSEVGSRTEHKLELKEKLWAKYDARGVLLREKDAEIARLKSLVKEKETESAEILRLRDQVSVLAADKSFLSAEVSALKSVVSQKDTDISLLDSRASYLKSALDDSQAACTKAKNLISTLSSERDGLASEVSTLHSAFRDFKEKMEALQEVHAQVLYNRVADLEAHVMDVSGHLEREFYPAYLTALVGRRWLLTHGVELTMVKCLKSPEYQNILGHALGRATDFALEEADFPLVHLLKSKKDSGMDEVLDCFLLDGPLADLPEAAHLQPCLEQLSVPIYHADVNAVVGETSLSFALLNVHTRAEGAKKHAAALRQLMVDIVSHPLSSQNLLGEASTSAVAPCVEDLDTDEDLGSVVCMPQLEDPRFEILP
ncbi:hypothetical protein Tco_0620560 [Tanacetum coccineum]